MIKIPVTGNGLHFIDNTIQTSQGLPPLGERNALTKDNQHRFQTPPASPIQDIGLFPIEEPGRLEVET